MKEYLKKPKKEQKIGYKEKDRIIEQKQTCLKTIVKFKGVQMGGR